MMEIEQGHLFDYGSLDNETRTFVQEKAQAIHSRLKRTAEDVIAIGLDLVEVKNKLPAMKFSSWLRLEFDMTRQTAYRFMGVARKFGSCNIMLQLPPTALYQLLDAPEIIIEQIESGDLAPTLPAIREAKRELQQQSPAQQPLPPESVEGGTEEEPVVLPSASLDELFPGFARWQQERQERQPEPALPVSEPTTPVIEPVQSGKSATLAALQSSESNEWYTPAQYVQAARELMGDIDLDPASNAVANLVVQATTYYDLSTNGLDKEWRGRVWLNPPYGRDAGGSNQDIWSSLLIDQYEAGITTEAVLLVNANTEAKWFQPLYNYLICFTNHRIRFYSSDGASSQPTQGNALVYFGSQHRRFIELFSRFGRVVREARPDEY